MKHWVVLLSFLLVSPAWAQLAYDVPAASAKKPEEKKTETIPVVVKKTRTAEVSLRPDWYGLFLLWTKSHPADVLAGLRDAASFDNLTQFLACDWVRDFRQNDVAWPARQTQFVQKFNERALNPPARFQLLTRGTLGAYVPEQQQFVFRPLDGAAFGFAFPADKIYGVEDDCAPNDKSSPVPPWPREFVVAFKNPELIAGLKMPKDQAEFFIASLPKNEKGEYDRRVVLAVDFDVAGFETVPLRPLNGRAQPPVGVFANAVAAKVYRDNNLGQVLAEYGTAPAAAR